MQTPDRPSSGDSAKHRSRDRTSEPLPPLVSAALEPGERSVAARLERIAAHGHGRARYTLLGELAQGGMGRIFRAWDEGLQREVAMKIVPSAPLPGSNEDQRADHERRLARFIDEARITGQLDHPAIVPVYEIGLDESGAVFFTMPLVRGQTLKRCFELVYEQREGWTLQRAVDVMHTVCLAVAFAHSKGVVHRDLKPENIMVGPFGEAYVMDWGLALLIGRSSRDGIVGTPAYMSPEQASARYDEVGPLSDVYSLGAILYELFARRIPHEVSFETRVSGGGSSFEGMISVPPRPLAELRDDVPPELAAICAKAMAIRPEDRYASALEMADDLSAWLAGRVVSVLVPGRLGRIRKWRARNRALSFALDAMAVLLLGSGAVFLRQRQVSAREVEAKHEQALISGYSANLFAADLGLRANETSESKRRLKACDEHLKGWEWRHLELRSDTSERVLLGHLQEVRAVAVSPDGTRIASGSDDATVILWDAYSGALLARLTGHESVVTALAFSPDGKVLASASRDHTVRLWEARTGAFVRVLDLHHKDVLALSFSTDGHVLASGDAAGVIALTTVPDGQALALRYPEKSDAISGLAFVPDSERVAAAFASGVVRLLDARSLECAREQIASLDTLKALAVDPLGTHLAVASEKTALVLDARTLEPGRTLEMPGKATALAFSPDGLELATGGFDNVLRTWNVTNGRLLGEYDGHDDDVNAVAYFPDGQRLATGSEDHSVRLWNVHRTPSLTLLELEGRKAESAVDSLAFSPDGKRLACGSRDHALRIFDAHGGAQLACVSTPGLVDALAWSAMDQLAFSCGDTVPRLAPAADPAAWTQLPSGHGFPRTMQFDRPGKRLVVRDSNGFVNVYDIECASLVFSVDVGDDSACSLALSGDGLRFAAGATGGDIGVWDARTGQRIATWRDGNAPIQALAFSPDDRRLAAGRKNRTIALFSTRTGARERVLEGHENLVSCLAFSPDGARLVSGSNDHSLRLWDPARDESLLTLHGPADYVTSVAFDPTGEVVAAASMDGTLRLWRTARALEP